MPVLMFDLPEEKSFPLHCIKTKIEMYPCFGSTVSLCEDNEHSSRWYTCRGLMPKPNVY